MGIIGIIQFTNLPPNFEYKDFYGKFSKFGPIIKLYISPTRQFGKVYFKLIEDANKAYESLKNSLLFTISSPYLSDNFGNDTLDKKVNDIDNSTLHISNMNIKSGKNINFCYDYVDVFGREVPLLKGADGALYMSLDELKKSGFNLFKNGSLPKPSEKHPYDEDVIKHFQYIMRVKAAKFIKQTSLLISEDIIKNVIEENDSRFFEKKPNTIEENAGKVFENKFTEDVATKQKTSPKAPLNNYHYNKTKTPAQRRNTNKLFPSPKNNFETNSSAMPNDNSPISKNGIDGNLLQENTGDNFVKNKQDPSQVPHLRKSKNDQSIIDFTEIKNCVTDVNNQISQVQAEIQNRHVLPELENKSCKTENKVDDTVKLTSSTTSNKLTSVVESISKCAIFQCMRVLNESSFIAFVFPDIFESDLNKLESITKECKTLPPYNPNINDMVAVLHGDNYVRGIVTNKSNGQYICGLIDYGIVNQVDEVRLLPNVYKTVPTFTCECTTTPNVIAEMSMTSDVLLTIEEPCKLTLVFGSGNKYIVDAKCWDPSTVNIQKAVENKAFFIKNQPEQALQTDDIVIIVAERNNSLLVRTRHCSTLLKEICQEFINYKGEPFTDYPKLNQLATCQFSDGNLYRVAVSSINNNNIKIEYIDYGNEDVVTLKDLMNIDEKLATIDNTLIKISLTEFQEKKFSDKTIDHLENISKSRKKFKVEKFFGKNIYNLVGEDNHSLSDTLIELDQPLQKIQTKSIVKHTDIKRPNVSLGPQKLLCLYAGDISDGNVSFCIVDQTLDFLVVMDSDIRDYLTTDNNPYNPVLHEVCLTQFEDEWFRAFVMKIDKNQYFMYFIDYGNFSSVTCQHLRKMPVEFAKYPSFAILCLIDDELLQEPWISKLPSLITEQEICEVTVLSKKDYVHYITFPSILKMFKNQ